MRNLAPMQDFQVAIVGGGASGALTAAWLLRLSRGPLSIALLDPSGRYATGVAYGTRDPVHLLNVPAAKMSADPQDPDHLLRWLRRRGQPAEPTVFLPRSLYGDYLQDFLAEAEVRAAPGVELHRLPCSADRYEAKTRTLRLSTGETLRAEWIVLATGNLPPAPLRVPGFEALATSSAYVGSPWSAQLRQLPAEATVALVGSGLTAVDVLLSLQERGHRGQVTLLSRHALLPRPHAAAGAAPRLPRERTPRALLRWLRTQSDWRAAIDAVRAITGGIWTDWSDRERRGFDRHLRHLWEVHRHQMAPQVAQRMDQLLGDHRARLRAGRLERVELTPDGVRLRLKRGEPIHCQVVVNCTGPTSVEASPLLRSLVEQGVARADRYGLRTEGGRVLDRAGQPQEWLRAVGPLRRSELWETTALREIRGQALSLARDLLETERVGRYQPSR